MTFQDLMGASYTGDNKSIQRLYKKNKEHFDAILAQTRKHNIIPLLGAGFSGVAYPTWTKLLRDMAAPFPDCLSELEKHLDIGEFEEAASVLREEMGEHDFLSELHRLFGTHTLPNAMKKISDERKLLPYIFHGPLFTTNFEQVIEEIYNRRIPVLCPHTDYHKCQTERALQSADTILFKLHGTIEDRKHLILDKESYDAFYSPTSDESVLVQTMKTIFASRQILFLGCSLETDRILKVLENCCGNREYFALVELPEETKNEIAPFSPNLCNADGTENVAYQKRRRFMSDHHINCIWYPYHQFDALDVFFKQLYECINPCIQKFSIPSARRELISRDSSVKEIYQRCISGNTPVFVTSPGGVGEFEVCHRVLRRMEQNGYSVLYVDVTNITTPTVFCETVAKVAGAPVLPDETAGNLSYYLTYIKEQVIACPHGTLYLDNWESLWHTIQEEESRMQLLKWMVGICHAGIPVLVSSQDCPTEYDVTLLDYPLPVLDRATGEDAALFQIIYTGKDGQLPPKGEAFTSLLRQLGGHPLSIVLVASQSVQFPNWESVLERWILTNQKVTNARHSSLDVALRMSWDKIYNFPDCIRVWGLMALSGEDLSITRLKALDSSWEDAQWKDSIAILHDASLLEWSNDGTTLQMLQTIKEAFFLLVEERDALPCFRRWYSYFDDLLKLANEFGDTKQPEAHVSVVNQLPQIFHLLDYMLSSQWLKNLSSCVFTLCSNMWNYFSFSSTKALPLLKKLYRLAEEYDKEIILTHVAECMGNIYESFGDLSLSLEYYNQAEVIYRHRSSYINLANTLLKKGSLFQNLGQLDQANECYCQAETIYRQENEPRGLAYILYARANFFERTGSYDQADRLYRDAELLHREQNDNIGLANALLGRVSLLENRGEYEKALELCRRVEGLYRQENDKQGLANALKDQATLYFYLDRADQALELYQKAEELYRESGDKIGLTNILEKHGILFYSLNQMKRAIECFQQLLSNYEEQQQLYGVAYSCAVLSVWYKNSTEYSSQAPGMEQRAREIADTLHPTEKEKILGLLNALT